MRAEKSNTHWVFQRYSHNIPSPFTKEIELRDYAAGFYKLKGPEVAKYYISISTVTKEQAWDP